MATFTQATGRALEGAHNRLQFLQYFEDARSESRFLTQELRMLLSGWAVHTPLQHFLYMRQNIPSKGSESYCCFNEIVPIWPSNIIQGPKSCVWVSPEQALLQPSQICMDTQGPIIQKQTTQAIPRHPGGRLVLRYSRLLPPVCQKKSSLHLHRDSPPC